MHFRLFIVIALSFVAVSCEKHRCSISTDIATFSFRGTRILDIAKDSSAVNTIKGFRYVAEDFELLYNEKQLCKGLLNDSYKSCDISSLFDSLTFPFVMIIKFKRETRVIDSLDKSKNVIDSFVSSVDLTDTINVEKQSYYSFYFIDDNDFGKNFDYGKNNDESILEHKCLTNLCYIRREEEIYCYW